MTSTDWRTTRAGPIAERTVSSRATAPATSPDLTATNTAVPVRIAGRAELPLSWPPGQRDPDQGPGGTSAKAKGAPTCTLGPRPSRPRGMDRDGAASTTRASMAASGWLARSRSRSTFAASRQSSAKPIAATRAMYARSLPTIAQVSPGVRFRGKRPIRS
jgi:hypothetical protein